jgi:Putative adhesin
MRREQFMVDTPPLIEVSLRSGEVKVVKGPEGSVEVTIDGSHPEQFVVTHTGSSVVVRQEPGSWQTIGRGAHRLSIVTPEGSGLEAWLASADLVVELPLKSLQAETASGDVRLGVISGDGDVKTASGDARVEAVGGELRFSSASGELRVGSLRSGWLRTASGDVVVDQAEGTTEIKTASGNVRVSRFTGAGLSVKTVSGDFTVGIPSGTELAFEANTMSGRVVLPDPAPAEQPVERSARLNFKSVSGDLRVRRV